jgi:hypothetical protein
MNRRELLKGLMAGGVIVAGELWMPGQKLISIPKTLPPNTVTMTVSGLDAGDSVYCFEVDGEGKTVSEIYSQVKYMTRRGDAKFEVTPGEQLIKIKKPVIGFDCHTIQSFGVEEFV